MTNVTQPSGVPAPPQPPPAPSRWGLIDAFWGWGVAIVLSAVVGGALISAAGYRADDQAAFPLWLVAIAQVPLWVGLLGAPLWAARRSQGTVRSEFGLAFRAWDLPVGVVIGVAAQFILVPVISWPWLTLLGRSTDDLSRTAEELVSKANDPLGVVLLVLIVVIGAPIIEETFYRGLFFRSLQKLVPLWAAIVLCGLGFGASHFELLALPALSVFGMLLAYLAYRTGRLGLPICTHLGFNAVTVWYLLR